MTFTVSAPATSGNLGPGFDQLGLAYDLRLTIHAEPAERFSVVTEGEGAGSLPTDEHNLIARTYRAACERLDKPVVPLHMRVINPIPVCGGLGSSATALSGGEALAAAVHGLPLDREAVFQRCAQAEGHPDNAAPAVFGGLHLCGQNGDRFTTEKIPMDARLRVLLATPCDRADTETMRRALPESWPQADLDFNRDLVQRLLHALKTGEPAGLACSQQDRIHQPYRLPLLKNTKAVFDLWCADPRLPGVFLSGSGPTVAAWVRDETLSAAPFAHALGEAGIEAKIQLVAVDQEGLRLGS
ncbi:homoserine kinase [Acanthopleuribacter pedis]|uniref:Homoserine kinase n=1 Tax=Acanthopleuribacter pedis TaxID=442870 RepID=A0A8J7QAB6_9BACT|nr:homoserine kinase [Acanthopleuribacter pedis]MBO1320742.1 homoserine kinase [Acanthopleuribacter pedis]